MVWKRAVVVAVDGSSGGGCGGGGVGCGGGDGDGGGGGGGGGRVASAGVVVLRFGGGRGWWCGGVGGWGGRWVVVGWSLGGKAPATTRSRSKKSPRKLTTLSAARG